MEMSFAPGLDLLDLCRVEGQWVFPPAGRTLTRSLCVSLSLSQGPE